MSKDKDFSGGFGLMMPASAYSTPNIGLPMDKIWVQEVIIATVLRRGDGKTVDNPIRIVTQVFTKEGKFIAELDPYDKTKQDE